GKVQVDALHEIAHGDIGRPVDDQAQRPMPRVFADVNDSVGQVAGDLAGHGQQKLLGQVGARLRFGTLGGCVHGSASWIQKLQHRRLWAYTSISSKSSLRAPHSGQTQLGGTSSQRVPGAIPSSGNPASSSYIQPQIKHIQVRIFSYSLKFTNSESDELRTLPLEWGQCY